MSKISIIKEFWEFLRVRKKWWLLPIIIMLLVLAGLMFLQTSPLSPVIYTLF